MDTRASPRNVRLHLYFATLHIIIIIIIDNLGVSIMGLFKFVTFFKFVIASLLIVIMYSEDVCLQSIYLCRGERGKTG